MNSPTPEKNKRERSDQHGSFDKHSESEKGGRQSVPWVMILLMGVIAILIFWRPTADQNRIKYSFFMKQVEADNIKSCLIRGREVTGKWKKIPENPESKEKKFGEEFYTILGFDPTLDFIKVLEEKGIEIQADSDKTPFFAQLFIWLLVPMLFLGFFWFMMKRNSDPMGSGMMGNFTKSPAKRFHASEQITTFEDVAGMAQAKRELQEVVEFLKEPEKFQRLGAEIPKGVLLMGSPGTGKTLLARATAGEAGVPFYSINGSEFIQMFVGVGASRVRDLFKNAKENAPCLIFIDEIDAVGRVRGAGVGGGHDEREQTLNQILSEMDGFTPSETVIVIAATNRPDVLDPALLRPGRFDRHVTIDRPTKEGRKGILKVHCRKVPLAKDVDLDSIAAGAIGFSGAELKNLVNEAALLATRNSKKAVEMEDFDEARDKVLMGALREEIQNDHEKRMTAYHESGHALLAWLYPGVDSVHKVSIIPRGRALGVTQLLPDEESYNIGEKRLHAQLSFIMGGRAAEKLIFDEYSAGAEDDLKRATQMARKMVGNWGMSEVIGPVAFSQGEEHPFLGKEMHEHRQFSEETARTIDKEVQKFLLKAADRATETLEKHRDLLDKMTDALLDKEALDFDDLVKILGEPQTDPLHKKKATSDKNASEKAVSEQNGDE